MVNGPGSVIFALRSVLRRRNAMSATSTGRAAPDPADDARHLDAAAGAVGDDAPALSLSMPSSAVAKRLE